MMIPSPVRLPPILFHASWLILTVISRGWIPYAYTHVSLWSSGRRCCCPAAHSSPLVYPPRTSDGCQGCAEEEEHTAGYHRRGRGRRTPGLLLGLHYLLGHGSESGFYDGCMFLCLSTRGAAGMVFQGTLVRARGALLRFARLLCSHDQACG